MYRRGADRGGGYWAILGVEGLKWACGWGGRSALLYQWIGGEEKIKHLGVEIG